MNKKNYIKPSLIKATCQSFSQKKLSK